MMVKWTHPTDPGASCPSKGSTVLAREVEAGTPPGLSSPSGSSVQQARQAPGGQGWGAEGGQGPGQWLRDAYQRQDSLAGAAAPPGEQQRCRRMLDTGSLGAWLEGGEWGEGLRHGEGPGELGSRTQTEASPDRGGWASAHSNRMWGVSGWSEAGGLPGGQDRLLGGCRSPQGAPRPKAVTLCSAFSVPRRRRRRRCWSWRRRGQRLRRPARCGPFCGGHSRHGQTPAGSCRSYADR